MLQQLIGKWKLIENDKQFTQFLSYYGYNWFKIKAALLTNVDVTISIVNQQPLNIKRFIESSFLTTNEDYIFDNNTHISNNIHNLHNLHKKHTITNDKIISYINGYCLNQPDKIVQWTETVYLTSSSTMVSIREWKDNNNNSIRTTQLFEKYN